MERKDIKRQQRRQSIEDMMGEIKSSLAIAQEDLSQQKAIQNSLQKQIDQEQLNQENF